MSGVSKPMRLPPLKALRVKNPTRKTEQPCVALMSSVLGCWASSGYNTAGCLQVELALRACMDAPPPQQPKASEINYHLGRFQNRVAGKRKQ